MECIFEGKLEFNIITLRDETDYNYHVSEGEFLIVLFKTKPRSLPCNRSDKFLGSRCPFLPGDHRCFRHLWANPVQGAAALVPKKDHGPAALAGGQSQMSPGSD